MGSLRPNVIHIYGFRSRPGLHKVLSKVEGLRHGYRFVTPQLSLDHILEPAWSDTPLDHLPLKSNWQDVPLFLIQPPSVNIEVKKWKRIREAILEGYNRVACELVVEADAGYGNYHIEEVILHSKVSQYL